MNLREQFEARFPVPAGVAWSEEHQNYGWIKKSAFQRVITYRALWTGWQESRAALVVTLPEPNEHYDPDAWITFNECVAAVSAQGLRVKP